MKRAKVVVIGPVGAGKTTFIRSLAVGGMVETQALGGEDLGKSHPAVALDFAVFECGDASVHLFGTPGQDRFEFGWETLCKGALGLLLLVSGHQPHTFPKARAILELVTSRIAIPFVVGVTWQDHSEAWSPEEVAGYFDLPSSQAFGLHPAARGECILLLEVLLKLVEDDAAAEVCG